MSYAPSYSEHRIAAEASADARPAFIRRTYGHLAGAILAFTALETVLLKIVPEDMIFSMFRGRFAWLVVLAAFMGAAWLADRWARSDSSPGHEPKNAATPVFGDCVRRFGFHG